MKVALYKGTRPGIAGLFNIVTRWWLGGPYSHCELIFSTGISASSSFIDKGVRFKEIEYEAERWDFIELDGRYSEDQAHAWFLKHEGQGYDVLGLLGFLLRPIKGSKCRTVCSEAVMEALGYEEAWRFDPCNMASTLSRNKISHP